jgi:hypothetical protein
MLLHQSMRRYRWFCGYRTPWGIRCAVKIPVGGCSLMNNNSSEALPPAHSLHSAGIDYSGNQTPTHPTTNPLCRLVCHIHRWDPCTGVVRHSPEAHRAGGGSVQGATYRGRSKPAGSVQRTHRKLWDGHSRYRVISRPRVIGYVCWKPQPFPYLRCSLSLRGFPGDVSVWLGNRHQDNQERTLQG